MTLLESGGKLDFVNRTFVYKICIIVVIIFDYICIFRMLCLVIVKDCAEPCEVIVFVKGIIITDCINRNTFCTIFFPIFNKGYK